MRFYEYRHVVGLEETNVVGNVYYAHHVRWQGRCREMFLHDHAPAVLDELRGGLALVTLRCSCEYLDEISALDEIAVRMRVEEMHANRLAMTFDYWRVARGGERLIARGRQEIASMRREGAALHPAPLPAALRDALQPFTEGGPGPETGPDR